MATATVRRRHGRTRILVDMFEELNHLFLTRDRERGADYYDQVEDETDRRGDDDPLIDGRSQSYPQDFRDGEENLKRESSSGSLPEGRQRMARRLSTPFSSVNFEAKKIELSHEGVVF